MILKIRGKEYDITSDDRFFDNGRYVSLLTQGHEPRLGKPALEGLSNLERKRIVKGYARGTSTFSVRIE